MRRLPSCPVPVDSSRRSLLGAALAAPVLWLAGSGRAAWAADLPATRELSLLNTHTGESLLTRYFEAGQYLPRALSQLDHLLRDHRSGDAHPIDPRLFDVLFQVAASNGREPRFQVISGYRSPASNSKLRSRSQGVAERSLHLEGRAIDVRLSGVSCAKVRDVALSLACGGVGYYASSDFVHLDTGRVRAWTG
jgi:uncharacterized protein YcbK (DUF882 family)